jgi:MYXO-CTERM domain-containing protein
LRIEQIPLIGPAQVIEDFGAQILAEHSAYQAGTDCKQNSGDEGTNEGETGDASLRDGGSNGSCACHSDEPGSSTGAAIGLLGLASLVGGRRRRYKQS